MSDLIGEEKETEESNYECVSFSACFASSANGANTLLTSQGSTYASSPFVSPHSLDDCPFDSPSRSSTSTSLEIYFTRQTRFA